MYKAEASADHNERLWSPRRLITLPLLAFPLHSLIGTWRSQGTDFKDSVHAQRNFQGTDRVVCTFADRHFFEKHDFSVVIFNAVFFLMKA